EGADQSGVVRTWLDGAPADRQTAQIGEKTARRRGLRMTGVGLLPQAMCPLLSGRAGERLPRRELVALALAQRAGAPRTENGLDVVPGGLVGGDHGDDP